MHTKKFALASAIFVASMPVLHCQDPKSGAENPKFSRNAFSKVHMVAIVNLSPGSAGETEFIPAALLER